MQFSSILLSSVLWLAACHSSGQPETPAKLNDVARLVSVGTAITETIFALGAGAQLVGVDDGSSNWLPEAAKLPRVGSRNNLSAEGLLSLKPTLVLLSADAGPPTISDQLKGAGVPVLSISANYSVDAVKEKVRLIARTLGREAKGEELVNSIDTDLKRAAELLTRARAKPKVMFVSRGPNVPNANMSGTGTTIDTMITLAGGVNPITQFQGFREMTDEAVVAAQPDAILITLRAFERSGGVEGVLKFPGIALTPAGKARRIVPVSDMYFLGFGPGMGRAVLELIPKLHPEL